MRMVYNGRGLQVAMDGEWVLVDGVVKVRWRGWLRGGCGCFEGATNNSLNGHIRRVGGGERL
jgi:hypothetical protein